MLKKVLIISSVVLLVGFGSAFYKGYNSITNEKVNTTDDVIMDNLKTEKQDMIEEDTIKEILETENTDKVEEKKENKTNQNSSSTTSQKVETNTNKTQSNNNTNDNTNIPTTSPVKEEPKQVNEWDKLGISEYEYYNSPAHSWNTVDFKISDFGSMEKALLACQTAGSEYTGMESYRYRCYEVQSYSGSYLGYHIEYFALQD